MAKRIASTLLTIIMFLFSFSSIAFALPANVADKTIVVDFAEDGQAGIQTAINSILAESDKGGWTIVVGGGTYNRFTVPSALTDLTIQAAENAQVIIHTLRQEEPPVSRNDGGGINIFAKGTTLKGLTVQAGKNTQGPWYAAAINTHHEDSGGANISLAVENCTISGSGVGFGIMQDCPTFSLKGCVISGFAEGLSFYGDNWAVPEQGIPIIGNQFRNCGFAIHGYFGGSTENPGTITFEDNIITGTKALRSKVVIQDNSSNNSSMQVRIQNNRLEHGLIGLVMLDGEDEIVVDVLANNTFGENSFYVEAIYPGTIDLFTTYQSPPGSTGRWESYLTAGDHISSEQLAYIESVIAAANASGSTRLSITGIDAEHLVETFTRFKDGIYWVSEPPPSIPTPSPNPAPGENLPSPSTGSLTVTKTMADGDQSRQFTFIVTLSRPLNGVYGDMRFEKGVATFTLGPGQSVRASGLPVGTAYTVEEIGNAGYQAIATGNVGTISWSGATASFQNIPLSIPSTGDMPRAILGATLIALSLLGLAVYHSRKSFIG